MTVLHSSDGVGVHHREAVGWSVVVGAAAVALVFRLWNIGSAPFIFDEPIFLSAAREQLLSGHWIAASPIEGTQGVRYGPTVFWFYSALQWAFGYSPLVALVAMCLLVTITQVLLARAVTTLFGGRRVTFLLMLGFFLSSPYLHFWSRLAWDQSVLICVAAAVGILCLPSTLRIRHAMGAGVLVGLAVSSHLMVVPFAVALFAVIYWELRSDRARLIRILGILVVTALIVNVPYLWFLATHNASPSNTSPDLASFLANLAETPAVSTSFGIEYFFDASWPDFVHWIGIAGPVLHLRFLVLGLIASVAAFGLLVSCRSTDVRERRIARLGLTTWIGSALLFAIQGVGQEPHYQFATWWVIPVGLVSALRLARSNARLFRPAVAVAATVVVLQLAFVVAWAGYVEDRSGTRGIHQGTPIVGQLDAIRRICSVPEASVVVRNETSVFPESLTYLVVTTPDCAGKRVEFCALAGCAIPEFGPPRLRLVYRDEDGAALEVLKVDRVVNASASSSPGSN